MTTVHRYFESPGWARRYVQAMGEARGHDIESILLEVIHRIRTPSVTGSLEHVPEKYVAELLRILLGAEVD